MATGNPIDQLAVQLAALQRQVQVLGKGTALAYSSIDNGALTATQTITDASGNASQQVTTIIGQQYDGTAGAVVVTGPPPPQPSVPTLSQAIGGVKVQWDGSFLDPQPGFTSPVVAPMDFAGVDVQVSADPNFGDTGFGPTHGTIVSAAGGELFVPWHQSATPLYARLVTRTKAGKYSTPSIAAGPVDSGQVQIGDIGFPIAQYSGGNTVYYTVSPATPSAPSWGFAAGDLWLEQIGSATGQAGGAPAGTPLYQTSRWGGSVWVLLQDQGISNALASAITAQGTADSKAKVFTQGTDPGYSGAANTAYWIDTANGNVTKVWNGAAWAAYTLGNGAITPNALIASDVIATGTITSALLETTMVLATTIIAGDASGTHAAMQSDGFHVYDTNAHEVVRLGTTSNDYFGVVDTSGNLVATIDEAGQANLAGLNVSADPVFLGTPFTNWIGNASGAGNGLSSGQLQGAQNYYGWVSQSGSGIVAEVGLIEQEVYVDSSRMYMIVPEVVYQTSDTGTECHIRVRDGGTSSPSLSSTQIYYRQFHPAHAGWDTSASQMGLWKPSYTGSHRLLLTIDKQGTGGINIDSSYYGGPSLFLIDLGPAKGVNATQNNITGTSAGTSAPPVQQYYVELRPAAHSTYQGNGTLRTDTSDVVQGWDPSGYNGDGGGWWTFNLPSITGTVNRVDWYVYNNFSYYNSGGQALWRPIHSGAGWPIDNIAMKGEWNPGVTYPKPGAVAVTLPSDWWPLFSNNGDGAGNRAIGIAAGPSGGSNETYYCRFDGPSARLRVFYTQ